LNNGNEVKVKAVVEVILLSNDQIKLETSSNSTITTMGLLSAGLALAGYKFTKKEAPKIQVPRVIL